MDDIVRCPGTVTMATVSGDDLDAAIVEACCQLRNPSDVLDGRLNKVIDVLDADHPSTVSDLINTDIKNNNY